MQQTFSTLFSDKNISEQSFDQPQNTILEEVTIWRSHFLWIISLHDLLSMYTVITYAFSKLVDKQ